MINRDMVNAPRGCDFWAQFRESFAVFAWFLRFEISVKYMRRFEINRETGGRGEKISLCISRLIQAQCNNDFLKHFRYIVSKSKGAPFGGNFTADGLTGGDCVKLA